MSYYCFPHEYRLSNHAIRRYKERSKKEKNLDILEIQERINEILKYSTIVENDKNGIVKYYNFQEKISIVVNSINKIVLTLFFDI